MTKMKDIGLSEILGEKDARQHEVRDEEGPDEDKAVESVVGKDDGVGN